MLAVIALSLLTGHVTDRTTGQPLPGVRVTLSGPARASATTNGDGLYSVRGLRTGSYTITLESNDVPAVQRRVQIHASNTTANFVVCSTTLDYSCGADSSGGPGA